LPDVEQVVGGEEVVRGDGQGDEQHDERAGRGQLRQRLGGSAAQPAGEDTFLGRASVRHPASPSSGPIPVANAITATSENCSRSSTPAIRPSCSTAIRWHIASSSGRYDDTITTALPCRASS